MTPFELDLWNMLKIFILFWGFHKVHTLKIVTVCTTSSYIRTCTLLTANQSPHCMSVLKTIDWLIFVSVQMWIYLQPRSQGFVFLLCVTTTNSKQQLFDLFALMAKDTFTFLQCTDLLLIKIEKALGMRFEKYAHFILRNKV